MLANLRGLEDKFGAIRAAHLIIHLDVLCLLDVLSAFQCAINQVQWNCDDEPDRAEQNGDDVKHKEYEMAHVVTFSGLL
jgi:hypothetical protein